MTSRCRQHCRKIWVNITRYYQGMIDLNLIEKGAKYSKLKKTFIIFICLNVPFPGNLPVYTFNNICEENKSIYLDDDATKVIINANGNRTGLSQDMRAFLDFLQDKAPRRITKSRRKSNQ